MKRIALTLAGLFSLALAGCPSDDDNKVPDAGNGGRGGSGGTGGTGGSGGTGGTAGTGGSSGTGGTRPPDARGPDRGRPADMGRGPDVRPSDGGARDGGGSAASATMSFFVTSVGAGVGGNLGGLAGADAKCQELAAAAGVGNKMWKAYLSSSTENARDRIGTGPWRNARGVIVANSVASLHDQGMNQMGGTLAETWPRGAQAIGLILDERGNPVPSGGAGMLQRHDTMTGSTLNGMVDGTNHCNNWTSSTGGPVTVGHSNRTGGGANPDSWNSAHTVASCGPILNPNAAGGAAVGGVGSGGGRGSIYCFATN